jgi:hypothetical protein
MRSGDLIMNINQSPRDTSVTKRRIPSFVKRVGLFLLFANPFFKLGLIHTSNDRFRLQVDFLMFAAVHYVAKRIQRTLVDPDGLKKRIVAIVPTE